MLRPVSWPHHLGAGAAVAIVSGLAAIGITGSPSAPERFDAKLVVVAPVAPDDPTDDALRIIEVIDQDFGTERRRGHERYIPVDFGVPSDVEASSPTAPDTVRVDRFGSEVRIRIGDPDVTITGRHRYQLGFTLPEARLSTGRLALDVIGTEETFETGRFEVVVTGFELADPVCSVGSVGATGGCTLASDGRGRYRAVVEPLAPGEGVTIGGTIVGRRAIELPEVAPPPPPREQPDRRLGLALGSLALGLAAVVGVHRLSARAGRDEVFGGGGAADAAFGSLAAPVPGAPAAEVRAPTAMMTDRELAQLATVEFAPPTGLEPWEGAVLLRESVDDTSVSAWFSGVAGRGFVDLEREGARTLIVRRGARLDRADAATSEMIERMLAGRDRIVLGGYDERFATFWSSVRQMQRDRIAATNWWRRLGPGATGRRDRALVGTGTTLALVGSVGLVVAAFVGLVTTVAATLAMAVVVPALAAFVAYSPMLPSRSATGAALALRTESFRRFLEASEGRHVEWAWDRGVLREYSAWAVALEAADAWSRAVERSSVVPDASMTSPLLFATMASTVSSSRVDPSSPSGGSGGFSGGSVGGGGGGGRSGSW